MLQGFKAMGLRDVYASLLVAHVVITLPYVVRTVVGCAHPVRLLADRRGAHAGLLLSAGAAARAGAGAGARLPDLRHVRLPGLDGQLPDLDLLHRRLDQDPADPDAAIRRGAARSDHRRDLGRPGPAGHRGAGDRRPPGRPAQARRLLIACRSWSSLSSRAKRGTFAGAQRPLAALGVTPLASAMKILVANPNTSTGVTDRLVAAGKLVASPGTELLPMTAPRGVPYIATRAEAAIGWAVILEMLAERRGTIDAADHRRLRRSGPGRRARAVRLSGGRHGRGRDAGGLHARPPLRHRELLHARSSRGSPRSSPGTA